MNMLFHWQKTNNSNNFIKINRLKPDIVIWYSVIAIFPFTAHELEDDMKISGMGLRSQHIG